MGTVAIKNLKATLFYGARVKNGTFIVNIVHDRKISTTEEAI